MAGARTAAGEAATKARAAATAARTAANRVAELEPGSAAAAAADAAARTAEDEALLAEAASGRAQAAETSADAKMHQGTAEGHQATAETAQGTANSEMMMAEARKTDADDLLAAQTAADTAAEAARKAADEAKADADAIETLLGAGATQTIGARQAQLAAETAALAAEAAADAANDATDPATAEAEQAKAEEQLKTANAERERAGDYLIHAKAAADAYKKVAIDTARTRAKEYSDGASDAYDSAKQNATDARAKADEARAAATKAVAARTDSANADKYAKEAEAAATAAEAARDAAETAKNEAMTAYLAAMAAETVEAVEAERDKAKAQNATATTQSTTADTKHTEAVDAADMAGKYARLHVIGLFKVANAYDIGTKADDDVELGDEEQHTKAQNAHKAAANAAIALVAADRTTPDPAIANNSRFTTTVTDWVGGDPDGDTGFTSTDDTGTRWPYDADHNDKNGRGDGKLTVVVNIDHDSTISDDGVNDRGVAAQEVYATVHDDPDTANVDESNYESVAGVGQFTHGFDISVDSKAAGASSTATDAGDIRTRVLVFTDKEQGKARVSASNVTISSVTAIADRVILDPNNLTSLTNATYDHDGDGKNALALTTGEGGGFQCPTNTKCAYVIKDGKVTSMSGYVVSASGTIPRVNPAEDLTYLAFGTWLRETLSAATNTYTFGAFADGGTGIDAENDSLTVPKGTATYKGSAAGVHSTATRVDFFSGDATLTATFGSDAKDAKGKALPSASQEVGRAQVSGMIHNIVSGGESVSDAIYLDLLDAHGYNSTTAGVINGDARMGQGTTNKSGGTVYPYEGTWDATFYNPAEDVEGTTDDEERTVAPGSVAGTFGVTMDDVATTKNVNEQESYVGSFGAHKE